MIVADVDVVEHAPQVFAEIRKQDGIKPETIHHSLDVVLNREQAFCAGEASGASGSFFFFSHDNQFIIKTMSKSELELFMSFLPDYLVHLKEHRSSLLARCYGIYTVKMEDVAPVSLILMSNSVQVVSKTAIRQSFDLKGSSINRNVKISSELKGTTTLKDVNLTNMLKL